MAQLRELQRRLNRVVSFVNAEDCQIDVDPDWMATIESEIGNRTEQLSAMERQHRLIVENDAQFERRVNPSDLLEQIEEHCEEMEHLLSEMDDLFQREAARCIAQPSYFRKLRMFRESNTRFQGAGKMYEGVATMIATDATVYPDGLWGKLVDQLNRMGEDVVAEKRLYEEQFLYGEGLRQPRYSLPRLFGRALLAQERLDFEMRKLARATSGALYADAGVKSMYRTKEKKAYHLSRDGSAVDRNDFDIWDLSRAMLSYATLGKIIDAINVLRGDAFRDVQVVNLFNRFKAVPDESWCDVMVHVVIGDEIVEVKKRIICEVQFSLEKMTMTRKDLGGHEAYANYRCAVELERVVLSKF